MLGRGEFPIWSLDRAAVHKSAKEGWKDEGGWRMLRGIHGVCRFPPQFSPDLHQVIEHAHALTCTELRNRLEKALKPGTHLAKAGTMDEFFAILKSCFEATCTPKAIAGNVKLLPKVWDAVKERKGDWAPADLR